MSAQDSERMAWLEANNTLHWTVEMLYVVDGYEVRLCYDGEPVHGPFKGESLGAAVDKARAQVARVPRNGEL
jgi:hypothetical protein